MVRAWTPGQHLGLLYVPKGAASLSSHPWNVGTNPDLAFVSFGQDNRLPDRRVLRKFPRSQHRPSVITPPRLKVHVHSDPVKRWNFRKADWKRICLLTGESVERLPPPDTTKSRRHAKKFARACYLRITMYPTCRSHELCAML